jgi:hypothetical protein
VDDDALVSFEHVRQQGTINTRGGKRVQIQLALPVLLIQCSNLAGNERLARQT